MREVGLFHSQHHAEGKNTCSRRRNAPQDWKFGPIQLNFCMCASIFQCRNNGAALTYILLQPDYVKQLNNP